MLARRSLFVLFRTREYGRSPNSECFQTARGICISV